MSWHSVWSVLYSKGSLCCNIWMHRFFFLTSLIMKDITSEFWKVRTFILKVFKHVLNYYFWRIYLHICQVFFFQMQSSCTFYTCMHYLLIISMVIALIPIFHANYTVHHIKKSMQSISWIFWLRIKGDVLKDLMSRGLTMEIALWLAADRVRWKSLQSSCLKHLMVQRVLREREIQVTHVFFSYISMNQYIYTSMDI